MIWPSFSPTNPPAFGNRPNVAFSVTAPVAYELAIVPVSWFDPTSPPAEKALLTDPVAWDDVMLLEFDPTSPPAMTSPVAWSPPVA